MRVIIAGSPSITRPSLVLFAIREAEIKSGITITEVVSGHASGVDKLGERYAADKGLPIKVFEAQWKIFGPRAGFIRNGKMVDYADALIAIWDGFNQDPRTKDIIYKARERDLKVFFKIVK